MGKIYNFASVVFSSKLVSSLLFSVLVNSRVLMFATIVFRSSKVPVEKGIHFRNRSICSYFLLIVCFGIFVFVVTFFYDCCLQGQIHFFFILVECLQFIIRYFSTLKQNNK